MVEEPGTRENEESGPVIYEEGETSGSESGSSGNSSGTSGEPRNPRFRSIEEIYEQGEVHLICLLADSENITFPEAVKDDK